MAEPLDFQFELIDKMSGPALGIAAALDKMASQMERAENRADRSEKKSKGFMETLRKWAGPLDHAINLTKEIGGAIFEFGQHVAEAAAKEQQFVTSLEALTGSKQRAEELTEAIDKLRPAFNGSEDQLKAMTKQFLALGLSIQDVGTLLPAIGDISTRMGDPKKGEEFADLITKIIARGEVGKKQLVELGKLGFGGIVTAGEKAGPAIDKVLDALEKMQGGAIGTGSALGARGFANSLQRASEVSENFFEGLQSTPAFKVIGEGLANLLDVAGPGSEIFKRLQVTVGDAISKIVTALFGDLAGDEGKQRMEEFFGKVIGFIEKLPPVVEVAVSAIGTMVDFFKFLFDILVAVGESFGETLGAIFVFGENVVTFFTDMQARAVEWGAQLVEGFVNGITGAWDKATDAIADGIESTVNAAKNALGIHSPSAVFAEMGKQTAAGYAEGIEASDRVASAVGDMVSPGNASAGGGVASGARTVHLTIPINVQGAQTNQETATTIKSTIEEMLPGMLASVFDHMAMEQGAA